MKKNKLENPRFIAWSLLWMIVSMMNLYICQVFAVSTTKDAIDTIVPWVIKISIPIAAIGFAALAYSFFTGSEQDAQKAVERAKVLILALIAIMLITQVVTFAMKKVQIYKWTPDETREEDINEILPAADIPDINGTGEEEPEESPDE